MNDFLFDSIINSLKVISQLKLNEKLCIRKGHLQIDSSSNIQFLKRWFYRDSREIVIVYLQKLMDDLLKLRDSLTDKWYISVLLIELENAQCGFLNLRKTYFADPYMIAIIDTYLLKYTEICQKTRTYLI